MTRPFRPIRLSIGTRRGHTYNAAELRKQLDNLTKNFVKFKGHMEEEAIDILYDALKPTFDLSQKYVPVDTSRLKDSGYLVVEKKRNGVQVELGYGYRGNPHYAIYVHEIPMRHAPPTSYKYLQRAIEEDAGHLQARLVKGFRTAGGVGG